MDNRTDMSSYTNEDLVWASGQFLTAHFPSEFADWDEDKVDEFIDEHRTEAFEYYPIEDIWKFIEQLAWSVRHYIKENN